MGGGLMQLVAYGAQDIYLTGNPQITFFKVVYRRHTNFSMESIQQTFSGTADYGNSVTATISRNGDLVHRMYLEHDLSFVATAADDTLAVGPEYGSHVMKEMELEIGGQRIDRQYGHWHSVWSQLTEKNASGSNTTLFNKLSGNGIAFETNGGTDVNGFTVTDGGSGDTDTITGKFWIPLYFWFCRNPGLALPLIALQYHEVKVKLTFEDIAKLIANDPDDGGYAGTNGVVGTSSNVTSSDFVLWADYIYLDTDERRRFAQVSHEYLIEQVQYESKTGGGTMSLNFNHPVKELVWAGVRATAANVALGDLYLNGAIGTGTYQLKLNGHDRFSARDFKYFTRTQVWQHHSGYGSTTKPDRIAVYSFALKPEEHQPSGTCNFSRIDNAQLVDSTTADVNIYAVNYNVLRIMSGMGGLAYSN